MSFRGFMDGWHGDEEEVSYTNNSRFPSRYRMEIELNKADDELDSMPRFYYEKIINK